jgi:hypothetical protein
MLWNEDEAQQRNSNGRYLRPLVLACTVLWLAGCASFTTIGDLRVLVIDYRGAPVAGAIVTINGKPTQTSEDGTCSLPETESLSLDLTAQHPRHLSYTGHVERLSRAELVVVRLASVHDVVAALDRALAADDLDLADQWLERATEEMLRDRRVTFLAAIVAYRRGDYERAIETLESFGDPLPDAVRLLRARINGAS